MKTIQDRKAFSLVEVTAAVGIASFSLIAVFGLLPVGLKTSKIAIEQTGAVNVLGAIGADLLSAPNPAPGGTTQSSTRFAVVIPPAGGASTPTGSPITKYVTENGELAASADGARYRLSIWIAPPSAAAPKQATTARLLLTWPAGAALTSAAGSLETMMSLNRN